MEKLSVGTQPLLLIKRSSLRWSSFQGACPIRLQGRPELAGVIKYVLSEMGTPWKHQEEWECVVEEKDAWVSFLEILPP